MKLRHYAEEKGVTYRTAWNHFNKGMIEGAYKLENGTIIVPAPKKELVLCDKVVVYARISSSENKSNLDKQAERLQDYCSAKGYIVSKVVKEIGSGLNDNRKKLLAIIKDPEVSKIVVEHGDRFSRFGRKIIEELLKLQNRELIIINESSSERDDLMQDFVAIITSFTARLYGQRRTKRKTERLIKELQDDK